MDGHVAVGQPAPAIAGTTLDGAPSTSRASAASRSRQLLGPELRPLPRRVPAAQGQARRARRRRAHRRRRPDGRPGRAGADFIAEYGATWPTVVDPDKAIKSAYRVVARPQTYFVDRTGILRSIQIGELTRRRLRAPVRAGSRLVTRAGGRRRSRSTGSSSATAAGPSSTASRSTVGAGEIVALLGPNGAGKTTTVEIIEGYRRADGGTVRVLGDGSGAWRARPPGAGRADAPGRRHRPADARRARRSGHTAASTPSPATPTSCSTWSGWARWPRTRYRRLSGGERQRLGLALALVGRPELVAPRRADGRDGRRGAARRRGRSSRTCATRAPRSC